MSGFVGSSSRRLDATKFLYVFATVRGIYDYMLYRIDALKHLRRRNHINLSSQQPLNDLQPLLVFRRSILPGYCSCMKLESIFYFMSINMYAPGFGIKDAQKRDVFMIRESDLMDLQPSEHNTDVEKYLIKCAPLNEYKNIPTVFGAQNKLYVLSAHKSDKQFEVYSPKLNAWHVLPPPPDFYWGRATCHVVVGETVYFQYDGYPLLSFNLKQEKWGIMSQTPALLTHDLPTHAPHPLVATLGMAFSFVYEEHDEVDPDIDNFLRHLTICATPLPNNTNFRSQEFMVPSISFNGDFSHALNSSRCPNVTDRSFSNFSDYIFGLDGGKVLCLISWGMGSKPSPGHYYLDTYATLSFFKVTPSRAPESNVSYASVNYASKKGDIKYVSRTCFKAKLRRCSKAKRQHSKGLLVVTCCSDDG